MSSVSQEFIFSLMAVTRAVLGWSMMWMQM
jgi:hypothetical protein